MKIDKLINNLFKESSGSGIILHEVISRSEKYNQAYEQWENSERQQFQVKEIHKAYSLKLLDVENSNLPIHILETSGSNGFAIGYNSKTFQPLQFQYMFDFIAQRTHEIGYKYMNSDATIVEKVNGKMELREKHYLKPRIKDLETPRAQLFGNILIEHVMINDVPNYISVQANTYHGRSYAPAQQFTVLFDALFSHS